MRLLGKEPYFPSETVLQAGQYFFLVVQSDRKSTYVSGTIRMTLTFSEGSFNATQALGSMISCMIRF